MIADPRSRALSTRFARAVAAPAGRRQGPSRRPALPELGRLARPKRSSRETELFFDSIVRENRSVLDLITADYTFVNERLARHYGIANVTGPEFRRVSADGSRSRAAAC